jgi:hypothetical protein
VHCTKPKLTPCSRTNLQSRNWPRNFLPFMGPEGSLPCSQQPSSVLNHSNPDHNLILSSSQVLGITNTDYCSWLSQSGPTERSLQWISLNISLQHTETCFKWKLQILVIMFDVFILACWTTWEKCYIVLLELYVKRENNICSTSFRVKTLYHI